MSSLLCSGNVSFVIAAALMSASGGEDTECVCESCGYSSVCTRLCQPVCTVATHSQTFLNEAVISLIGLKTNLEDVALNINRHLSQWQRDPDFHIKVRHLFVHSPATSLGILF